jgi:hypothetical protein
LRLIRDLLGEPGFLATVARRLVTCELDSSVGESGPHDFAVRTRITRQLMPIRPSHPASNTRDDREAPLFAGTGCAGIDHVLLKNGRQIFHTPTLKHPIDVKTLEKSVYRKWVWGLRIGV